MNVLVKFGRIWCLPSNFREYVVRDMASGRVGLEKAIPWAKLFSLLGLRSLELKIMVPFASKSLE